MLILVRVPDQYGQDSNDHVQNDQGSIVQVQGEEVQNVVHAQSGKELFLSKSFFTPLHGFGPIVFTRGCTSLSVINLVESI